jgi:hypothetical protein
MRQLSGLNASELFTLRLYGFTHYSSAIEVFLEWFRSPTRTCLQNVRGPCVIDSHALDSIGEKVESMAAFQFH